MTTSSPIQALIRGVLVALIVLALLGAAGLRLEWRFCAILTLTIGVPMGLYFYDGSKTVQPRQQPEIVMRNVLWNFSVKECDSIEEFISKVTAHQPSKNEWTPHESLPVRGPIEIQLSQYHDDENPERIITLNTAENMNWTHAQLLHEIHKYLNHECGLDSLEGETFFEGLGKCSDRRYQLYLGS